MKNFVCWLQRAACLLIVSLPIAASAGAQHAATTAKGVSRTAAAAKVASGSGAGMSLDTGASDTIHVSLGTVAFLNSKERVKRIYISNPTILDSYTASPNQVVVTGKAPGVSSVVVWDETDMAHTYVLAVDVGVGALRTALAQALPKDTISVQGDETRLLLSGRVATTAESETAAHIASLFAKDVVNSLVVNAAMQQQVRLKVRIVEVDRSRLSEYGINIFNPTGNTVAVGSTTQFPSTASLSSGTSSSSGYSVGGNTLTISDPLNFLFYSAKANIGVTIQDLESKQILQILAEPTITTISGQKANFLAGGEFPFPVVQGSSTGLTSITIQFRPYGVKLEFLPEVNVDGTIALKVAPEVSALDYTNSVTISGYTIPALSTRKAETQVVLRSGQSFAISGLLDKRTTDKLSRTPGIASIPILGALFKSKGVNLSTTELVVVVTPSIVDPLHDNEAVPAEPVPVRPFLTDRGFDNSLPKTTSQR